MKRHGSRRAADASWHHTAPSILLAGVSVFGITVCQPQPRTIAPLACAVILADAPASVPLAGLAGSYTVTFVAEAGSRTGRAIGGRFSLEQFDDETRAANPAARAADANTRYVLYGSAEFSPDSIGAETPGTIESALAARPGVLGVEWRTAGAQNAPWQSVIRLGADGNAGGQVRFDGAYFALMPRRLDPTGFSGRWESGGGPTQASGYFCAERTGLV